MSSHCRPTISPNPPVPHARRGGGANNRLVAGAVFVACVGLLGTAAWLSPEAKGFGTHRQLGLPACGFKSATGLPCATCGMTTAFSYAADGDLIASFRTQPAGFLLVLFTAVCTLISGYAMVSGISLAPLARAVFRPRVILVGVVVLLASWTYTIIISSGLGVGQ